MLVRIKTKQIGFAAIRRETTKPGRFNESEMAMCEAPVKGTVSHSVEPD